LVTSVVMVTAAACAPATVGSGGSPDPPAMASPSALTFLAEFTRPSGTAYPRISDSTKFGSMSGLVRDAASGEWLAVIDDRAGSRVAWLSIAAAEGQLDVSPLRLQTLTAGPGVEDRIATQADLEGVVALPDGTFLMSEEGHRSRGAVWPPAILQVTRDGVVTGTIAYPPGLQISEDGKTGIRDNQGFESLTRTPGGRIITGLEQPTADKPVTSTKSAGESLLMEFEQRGTTWIPGRQWQYAISPTPTVPGFPTQCSDGENGLVELLALTETTLISMERSCWLSLKDEPVNTILLFVVTLSGDTARKTLLLDLSTIAPKLSPGLARLDNFEGLSFGPLVNGRPTLLVMSDDNFRPRQKTSLLLFAMQGLSPSQ
jgi:hypothetical protein